MHTRPATAAPKTAPPPASRAGASTLFLREPPARNGPRAPMGCETARYGAIVRAASAVEPLGRKARTLAW